MFLVGCSLVLSLVLSVAGDGSRESQDAVPAVTYSACGTTRLSHSSRNPPVIKQELSSTKLSCIQGTHCASKLPAELTDYIIDLLDSDLPSLKACSLASRIFLPRSRYYLFRTLSIQRHGKDPYKLCKYSNVARCVRRVFIHGNLLNEVASSSLVELGLVESLHLVGSHDQWKDVQWTLSCSQFPRFPRLKELSLSRVYFRSLGEMIRTLRSQHDLSKLSVDLEDTRYTNLPPRVDLAALAAVRLPLRTLHMRLNFLNAEPGDLPQVLLASAGDTLRYLSLEVLSSPQRLAFSIFEHIDLSYNTSLESLDIQFPWYISRHPWRTGISQDECQRLIHILLHQLTSSSSFRKIKFRITFPKTSHYNNNTCWQTRLDFRFLDTLAQGFAQVTSKAGCGMESSREVMTRMTDVANGLTEVELELGLPSSRMSVLDHQLFEEMKKLLHRQLPLLTARGILRIVEGKTVS